MNQQLKRLRFRNYANYIPSLLWKIGINYHPLYAEIL